MTNWLKQDGPREKLLNAGADALSDAELVAIFLRTGTQGLNVVDVAGRLLAEFGSLRGLITAEQNVFCQGKGLGLVTFVQLKAVLELSKRYFAECLKHSPVFDSVEHTRSFLISQMRDELNEVFAIVILDSQHRMIQFKKLFYGTINSASVYPRVILMQALEANAAAIILAHNHPSGVAEPSLADRQITKRICSAMELVDVDVLDHFVVGEGYAISFAERGWM